MITSDKSISETTLATCLSGLAHGLVRELAMACRKVSIYGPDHPMGIKAIEKPFFAMDEIFRYRNHVSLNLHGGLLYALNIRLRQSLFTEELVRYMQILQADAVLFSRHVTMRELALFIDRLVKRVDLSKHENLLSAYLEANKVSSIEVNSEKAFKLFESQNKYRGDAHANCSVKNIALQQLGISLQGLADVSRQGEAALEERGIDFTLEVIEYLLPEKFAAISAEDISAALMDIANRVADLTDDDRTKPDLLDTYKALYRLVDFHPRRNQILAGLEQHLSAGSLASGAADELSTPAGAIRIAASERMDALLQGFLLPENRNHNTDEYGQVFQRLMKTGQQAKATDVISRLLQSLASPDGAVRQQALQLLVCSIAVMDLSADTEVLEAAVNHVVADLSGKKETYEFSEVIWQLLTKCHVARRFETMARLAAAMAKRRQCSGNVTVFDSIAVKKVFESLNRGDVIKSLIDDMMRADHETSLHIHHVLISIGSEEVAAALSDIITHPIRQVRQQALKVLAELGAASLAVFSRILCDDGMFERESGRHELPDSKWYIIRNSIFVLGSLQSPEGVMPLRLRISDNDVRVRREIISALEKIGGEDACDLLMLMADDPVKEIRERAMIAVGQIGRPEIAPQLFHLAARNPAVAIRAVSALGKIGGDEARGYLVRLLDDDQELERVASFQVPKEQLRLAAVTALGKIGDNQSIAALKGYQDNLSATQKIFFKKSPVNRAISEILSRR